VAVPGIGPGRVAKVKRNSAVAVAFTCTSRFELEPGISTVCFRTVSIVTTVGVGLTPKCTKLIRPFA
jgi:hypothetical protein